MEGRKKERMEERKKGWKEVRMKGIWKEGEGRKMNEREMEKKEGLIDEWNVCLWMCEVCTNGRGEGDV